MERQFSMGFATYLAGAVLLVQAIAALTRIFTGCEIQEFVILAVVGAIFFVCGWCSFRKVRSEDVGRG